MMTNLSNKYNIPLNYFQIPNQNPQGPRCSLPQGPENFPPVGNYNLQERPSVLYEPRPIDYNTEGPQNFNQPHHFNQSPHFNYIMNAINREGKNTNCKFFSNIFSLDLGNNNNYDTTFNQMNSDLNDFLQDYNGDN